MSELIRWGLFLIFGIPVGAPVEAETSPAPPPSAEIAVSEDALCTGIFRQGGLLLCDGEPGEAVRIGGVTLVADSNGSVQFGISRSSPLTLGWESAGQVSDITIKERHDKVTEINGIPCDKIDARTPEQKAKASESWQKKQKGWASFNEGRGALDGFIKPAEGRISSPYGFTRSYITTGCDPKTKVHWGYDIAAPTGTQIIAPAGGTVTLAEDDLYYEGGTIFLDHGHGLMSIFLHMSELDAEIGDVVKAGDPIGKIGATGRVTGPHLHWAVKWRDTSRNDRKGDFYIDPALYWNYRSKFTSRPARLREPQQGANLAPQSNHRARRPNLTESRYRGMSSSPGPMYRSCRHFHRQSPCHKVDLHPSSAHSNNL